MKPAGEVLFFSFRNVFIKISKTAFGCVQRALNLCKEVLVLASVIL
jgi:hypothetical protein